MIKNENDKYDENLNIKRTPEAITIKKKGYIEMTGLQPDITIPVTETNLNKLINIASQNLSRDLLDTDKQSRINADIKNETAAIVEKNYNKQADNWYNAQNNLHNALTESAYNRHGVLFIRRTPDVIMAQHQYNAAKEEWYGILKEARREAASHIGEQYLKQKLSKYGLRDIEIDQIFTGQYDKLSKSKNLQSVFSRFNIGTLSPQKQEHLKSIEAYRQGVNELNLHSTANDLKEAYIQNKDITQLTSQQVQRLSPNQRRVFEYTWITNALDKGILKSEQLKEAEDAYKQDRLGSYISQILGKQEGKDLQRKNINLNKAQASVAIQQRRLSSIEKALEKLRTKKQAMPTLPSKQKIKGIAYLLRKEKYLKGFASNAKILKALQQRKEDMLSKQEDILKQDIMRESKRLDQLLLKRDKLLGGSTGERQVKPRGRILRRPEEIRAATDYATKYRFRR